MELTQRFRERVNSPFPSAVITARNDAAPVQPLSHCTSFSEMQRHDKRTI